MVVFESLPVQYHDDITLHPGESMFWFHCNGCYCQPQPDRILSFYITNCSHIYCANCLTSCTKEKCKVCHAQCTTLELNGKLQPAIEKLFNDPVQLLQNTCKQLQSLTQMAEFQKSHQRRLFRHYCHVYKQQTDRLQEMNKVFSAQIRVKEKEILEVRKENHYLKCLLSKRDSHCRKNSNSGAAFYPVQASPNRASPYGRNTVPSQQPNKSGSSNILNCPGRILMRTPPSCGRLGSASGSSSITPGSGGFLHRGQVSTPLTVPRPICLSQTE